MFWKFGGYANVSAIDTILDKPDFTLEELLDESDLIQELKQHNGKLLDYLRQRNVLERLLEYAVAPRLEPVAVPTEKEDEADTGKGRALPFGRPRASSHASELGNDEEQAERRRNKYAYVACEILASDNWSICEALMETSSRDLLRKFWLFLTRPIPLDPLQASYFTKVNEALFDRKTEEMIEFLKTVEGAVPDMLRHVDCPMVMDLLLKIISLERTDSGQGIVEWLYTQDLMPSLLSFLDPQHSWATQTSAGDFMKAIITVSANASQNEQTCIGPNELTRQLVSTPCVEQLINYMLGGGNALTVGVGIVIEVIRKNNSDYDPDVGAEASSIPSSRDPIYLGTLLRMFAENVPNFMRLVMNAPALKARLESTFGDKIEPLGFDRFKTCELMAELLHCSNMGLLNEVGSGDLIAARDAQRRRLRSEGRLSSLRGEEATASAEDLTMRMAHSSPADEGRRLEVTNADDDGFEEVSHGTEIGEDTSHEFVKAEEEIPSTLPASSLLDKDEDDFVEEPLSSPRLHVRDDQLVDEAHFDEADLMVAPLSPSKKPPSSEGAEDKEQSEADDSAERIELLHLEDKPAETERVDEEPEKVEAEEAKGAEEEEEEAPIVFAPTIPPPPAEEEEDGPSRAETSVSQEKPAAPVEGLSPHPEDTPAPLFSKDAVAKVEAAEAAEEIAPPAPEPPVRETAEETEPAAPEETEPCEASIIVGHRPEPAPAQEEVVQVKPVVGDFLKMQFVEHRVVPTILSFFFAYPWNNFLHNVVYDIVQQVFNGPMDRGFNPTLAISLFEAADVTTQIISGQLASEQSQTKNKTRMGYMGHLTLIAEEVVKFTERHPPELLSETVLDKVMSQDWINYVEGALAETRERDNAILGGVRPEIAVNNRPPGGGGLAAVGLSGLGSSLGLSSQGGASSALAEAGLNGGLDLHGNGDGNPGPFSISAGISSGFHSSSDEDEDDTDENDEDVNNEFRAYTDPLNADSSMHPPSIPPPPPPPPPLNIPPSRARLQLAARLAMNKRQAAESANGGDDGSASGHDAGRLAGGGGGSALTGLLQNAPVVERLRNPFADDDDDEVDDDDDDDLRRLRARGEGSDEDDEETDAAWRKRSWWGGYVRQRSAREGAVEGDAGEGSTGPRGGRDKERFGDGRDDSSDEAEDEEFGDFAMPERDEGGGASSSAAAAGAPGGGSGFDADRERVLLKPLPVYPLAAGAGKRSSLWPFGSKERPRDDAPSVSGAGLPPSSAAADKDAEGTHAEFEITEEPEVLGEDGHRVSRVVEAKARKSLEEPDEDEVVV